MSDLAVLSSHPAVRQLSLALLHFVWQGFAVLLVAGAALLALRRAVPRVRYAVLLGLFLMMAALPPLTFAWLGRGGAPAPVAAAQRTPAPAPALRVTISPARPMAWFAPSSLPRPRVNWLPLAWAGGVCLLSLRLLGGWIGLYVTRRRAAPLCGGEWESRLARLVARLQIARRVELLVSGHLRAPTLIGWLRPAVLLPASVLTGLSAEQLEMILAHELAHLRRADYLVNLLQTLVETLLFYHPAVWWLSRRLRLEREHCCDDIAVEACGSAVEYAHALAALGELPAPQLAVTAGGDLSARLHRLLQVAPRRRARRPSWVAGAVALAAVVGLAAGVQHPTVAVAKTATRAAATVTRTAARQIAAAVAMYAPPAPAAPAVPPAPPTAPARAPAPPVSAASKAPSAAAPSAAQIVYEVIPLTFMTPASLTERLGVPLEIVSLDRPPSPAATPIAPSEKAALRDFLPPGLTFFGAAAPEARQLLVAGTPEAVREFADWVKLIDRKPQPVLFSVQLHTSLPRNGLPYANADPEQRYRYFALSHGATHYEFGPSDRLVNSFAPLTNNLLPGLAVVTNSSATGEVLQGIVVYLTPRINGDGSITVSLSASTFGGEGAGAAIAGAFRQVAVTMNLTDGQPLAISLPEIGRVAVLSATVVKEAPSR